MEVVIINLVMGVACAILADTRGRSALAWFLLGFFFGCFALIGLFVIPDLKVQEEKERRLRMENRRLREQLRKDRAIADQRYQEHVQRLSVHDRALGMDTRPPQLQVDDNDIHGVLPPRIDLPAEGWFYAPEGANEPEGPVTLVALQDLWAREAVGATTLVWNETLRDWMAVRDVDGLEEVLDA